VTPLSVAPRERSPSRTTDGQPMSVDDRLAGLETAENVRGLLAAYANACVQRDVDALASIMHDGVVLTVGDDAWRGKEEVLGFFRQHWASSDAWQRHFVTNISFEVLERNRAEVTAYLLHVSVDGDCPQFACGSYRDTFTRHDGTLLLRELDIALDQRIDLHDKDAATALAGQPR